ncbi:hypothetical protein ULMS_08720 [Patiriisocius marinistellae]|uniref:Uncharacterized protein n=1 Tax=Patiriisocius marinistellae TaxID=2494560 RepID=A0A5J4FW55_9FLAO|nr:hypothetical protein [Patiriisocius marinistellae]GEQ85364.1 hypothetical protein ULMS_08720 [Patiriisocius marinistellae]
MKYLSKILKTTACVFVISLSIVGCSRESNTLEVQEDSQNLTNTIQHDSKAPNYNGEVEYLNSEHPEFIRNFDILTSEGVEMLTLNDAIKTFDEDGNTTYLFTDERNELYGTLYLRGEYRGSIKYTHTVDANGNDQLNLSNIRGDRSVNVFSEKNIASKLSGGGSGGDFNFTECVSVGTMWVFYNTLSGPPPHNSVYHAYINSVIAVNGIVIGCGAAQVFCWVAGC